MILLLQTSPTTVKQIDSLAFCRQKLKTKKRRFVIEGTRKQNGIIKLPKKPKFGDYYFI